MKNEKLNVGTKIGTEKYSVEVSVKVVETPDDMVALLNGDESPAAIAFVCKMFNRGWRIWCQEQSGARDYVEGLSAEQRKDKKAVAEAVQNIIDTANPLAPAKRTGRTAAPVVLKEDALQAAMASGNMDDLKAMLAAAGIKANFQ